MWESLPSELLHAVVENVDLRDLLCVAAVCTKWRGHVWQTPKLRLTIYYQHCNNITRMAGLLAALQRFHNVQQLVVGSSVSDDVQLAVVALCPKLKTLVLNSTVQSAAMIALLRSRSHLRSLKVHSCRLSLWLVHLTQITHLGVSSTLSIMSAAEPTMPNIRVLDMSATVFDHRNDAVKLIVKKFPNLQSFIMDNAISPSDIMVDIGLLLHLSHFSARNTSLSDASICAVAAQPSMKLIVASGSNVTPRCIHFLSTGRFPPELAANASLPLKKPVKVLF